MTGRGTTEDPMSLGEKTRATRLERGISLRQLAAKVGCSPPFVSDIELGRRFPSEATLASIANTLERDISVDILSYRNREAVAISGVAIAGPSKAVESVLWRDYEARRANNPAM